MQVEAAEDRSPPQSRGAETSLLSKVQRTRRDENADHDKRLEIDDAPDAASVSRPKRHGSSPDPAPRTAVLFGAKLNEFVSLLLDLDQKFAG